VYTLSMLLTKALLVVGLYELQVLREAKGSTETRHPGHCFSIELHKMMSPVDIMPCGQTITSDL
jgi:uracil-DNA glycosylase